MGEGDGDDDGGRRWGKAIRGRQRERRCEEAVYGKATGAMEVGSGCGNVCDKLEDYQSHIQSKLGWIHEYLYLFPEFIYF